MTSLVQSKSNSRSGGSALSQTLSIVLTAPATPGNSIGIAFGFTSSQTPTLSQITDDQSNVYVIDQNNTRSGISSPCGCASLLNLGNAPQSISITVTTLIAANIGITATVYEIAGAGAVDVSATGTTGNTTALNAAFSTAAANEFAFASVSNNNSSATYSPNNGWTGDLADNFTGVYTFHNSLTTAGANALNETSSPSVFNLWNAVTLAPPPAFVPRMNYAFQPMMAT